MRVSITLVAAAFEELPYLVEEATGSFEVHLLLFPVDIDPSNPNANAPGWHSNYLKLWLTHI